MLGNLPDPTGNLLRTLLNALDDWSRLTRRSRYAALPLAERSERLEAWLHSGQHHVRSAVTSVVVFVAMGYCGHPEVRGACGWIFPCGYER